MAVMTHARIQPTTTTYDALNTIQRRGFDQVMEEADNAGDNDTYRVCMRMAAVIADIALPPGGEIRKCACSCCCGAIFDPNHRDAHVIETTGGYNLGRVQCPDCADTHRETAE